MRHRIRDGEQQTGNSSDGGDFSTEGEASAASFFPSPVFHRLKSPEDHTQYFQRSVSEHEWCLTFSLINLKCAKTKQMSFLFRYYLRGS